MDRMVARTAPYLYALLRIMGALLYACHGGKNCWTCLARCVEVPCRWHRCQGWPGSLS
jgi:hypothetical protein